MKILLLMVIKNIFINILRCSIHCVHDIQFDESETINYKEDSFKFALTKN